MVLGAQEGPGAPHSRCQGVPEVQGGRAGPECYPPWGPESRGSPVGRGDQEGRARWSQRSRRSQDRPSRLSVQRPLGPPSRPSSQPPGGGGRTGTALLVLGGPLLLCHPLVPKVPGALAVLGARGGQTQQTRCCHRRASRGGLGALGALGGQAFPSCQIRGWHPPAPPSLLSIHSSRGGPAAQGSRSRPCAQDVRTGPGVLGSPARPWLLSGQGPGLGRRG